MLSDCSGCMYGDARILATTSCFPFNFTISVCVLIINDGDDDDDDADDDDNIGVTLDILLSLTEDIVVVDDELFISTRVRGILSTCLSSS